MLSRGRGATRVLASPPRSRSAQSGEYPAVPGVGATSIVDRAVDPIATASKQAAPSPACGRYSPDKRGTDYLDGDWRAHQLGPKDLVHAGRGVALPLEDLAVGSPDDHRI